MADRNTTEPWVRDYAITPQLRARVEAYGLQVIINSDDDDEVLGYYINDPVTGRLCCTCSPLGGGEDEGDAVTQLRDFVDQLDREGIWWHKPKDETPSEEPAEPASGAEKFSEYAERELVNIKSIISEVEHLAHEGEDSIDPALTFAAIKRIAREAQAVMYGKFWDELCHALKKADAE